MSIHPSLKIDPATAQQRSVLSRIERIKDLMKRGLWKENQSVVGLPKTKVVKIKAKKGKAKAAEGTETVQEPVVAPAAAVATPASAPTPKPAKAKG